MGGAIRRLTRQVSALDSGGIEAVQAYAALPAVRGGRDEVSQLQQAFHRMAQRLAEQWQTLAQQDRLRREFIANVSHDLRTPLTSLHGYLETLSVKAATLSEADRRRYLEIALAQSRKGWASWRRSCSSWRGWVRRGENRRKSLSLSELLQDVFQKFRAGGGRRNQRLHADIPTFRRCSPISSMIERVLTNLLDNAIRHTPPGGDIGDAAVAAGRSGDGAGQRPRRSIPRTLRAVCSCPSVLSGARRPSGGLGLMIVRRILRLHDSDIQLIEQAQSGACFRFAIPPR